MAAVGNISSSCARRIKMDIKEIVKNPLPGVSLELDEEDFMTIHALIVGPQGTPYENGFFYFILKFPYDYPWNPPNVQLMTTGNGTVRFNPNFYSSGKVCLSILGTWPGPGWTPQMSLSSVLLSMQSLMNEKPYCNEPGRDAERCPGDFEKYNLVIRHDTLRVAVLGMVKNTSSLTMPRPFTVQIQKEFLHNYNFYEEIAVTNIHLSDTPNVDPLYFYDKGYFEFDKLLDGLEALQNNLLQSQRAQHQ